MANDRFKFRFWDSFNAVMCFSVSYPKISEFFDWFDKTQDGGNSPVLMQFTGLKDCEGKDVYEGDIFWWTDKDIVKVIFKNGYFCLEDIKSERYYPFWPTAEFVDGVSVIGNIYENPNLLETKNDH